MMAVAEKAAESVKKAAAPKKAAPAKAAAKVPAKNFMASRIKPDEIIRILQGISGIHALSLVLKTDDEINNVNCNTQAI